jgi:hypothetical protein
VSESWRLHWSQPESSPYSCDFSSLRSSYTATNIETAVRATFLTPWPPLVVVLGQPRGIAIRMHILALSKGDDE